MSKRARGNVRDREGKEIIRVINTDRCTNMYMRYVLITNNCECTFYINVFRVLEFALPNTLASIIIIEEKLIFSLANQGTYLLNNHAE